MIWTLPFRHSISVTAWTALVCCCYGHNWKEQPSLLVLVVSYLGWFEIDQLSSLSSLCVINMLKCQWLYSDNGNHYTSQTFPELARSWLFLHVTSSPEYPQSNGLSKELSRAYPGTRALVHPFKDCSPDGLEQTWMPPSDCWNQQQKQQPALKLTKKHRAQKRCYDKTSKLLAPTTAN